MEKCCEHLELAKCAAQPGIHNAIGFIQQNYCSHRVLFRNDYPFALKRALLSLRFDHTWKSRRWATWDGWVERGFVNMWL